MTTQAKRPPAPEGMRAPGIPGQGQIVPFGQGEEKGNRPLSVWVALALCAVGSALTSTSLSLLAPVLVASGFAAALRDGSVRVRLAAVLAAVLPGVLVSAGTGLAATLDAMATCIAALVVAILANRGRLSAGSVCVVVAALALAHLGCDALRARSQGQTLSSVMEQLIDAYQLQLAADTLEGSLSNRSVGEVLLVVWPHVYVLLAAIEAYVALLGARIERAVSGDERPGFGLADYDLPLWIVGVAIVALAAFAVVVSVPVDSDALLMVTANLALALRLAFAAQGAALVLWHLRGRQRGPLVSWTLGMLALFLELQFFVLTVAGLADVWFNFRHLARGDEPRADGHAELEQDRHRRPTEGDSHESHPLG